MRYQENLRKRRKVFDCCASIESKDDVIKGVYSCLTSSLKHLAELIPMI